MSESQQPTHHGYAINVKDHHSWGLDHGPLTDDQVAELYDSIAEAFWYHAQQTARDHGFRNLYSAGRMGGWAEVDPQPDPDWDIEEGADYMTHFRALEADLLALMADYREEFLTELADAVERANAEPAERAYWEARDTITI